MQRQSHSRRARKGQPETPGGQGLILKASPESRLNKAQREFNQLVRQIEQLQRSIAEENRRLDELVAYYASKIRPFELEILSSRREVLRNLQARLLKLPKGRSPEKNRLLKVLKYQMAIHMIELEDNYDDEFLKLFPSIMKCTPEEFERREKAKIQAEMQKDMRRDIEDMDVDVDLSGLAPGSTVEEIQRTLDEVRRKVKERLAEEEQPKTERSERQRLKEGERKRLEEEMKSKDLARLYKQLAKLLHPDLEQDPQRRTAKEGAMKQLNAAHAARDLHAMLKMEIEWITQEGTDSGRLSDQKLAVYNAVLKEQVEELNTALYSVCRHPRFAPLEPFSHPFLGLAQLRAKDLDSQVLNELEPLRQALEVLKGELTPEDYEWLVVELGPIKQRRGNVDLGFGFSFL